MSKQERLDKIIIQSLGSSQSKKPTGPVRTNAHGFQGFPPRDQPAPYHSGTHMPAYAFDLVQEVKHYHS